ncbi:hypothetical protein INH39_25880 [Massilia violaceinigra]|uniref:Monoheme cytochrome SoxX n=1 Tax=Massilia violaceinigra TaxID=2045208 RepID=A0ABY4A2G8_9BURK|nr:hypothetical protein [Massilia violaceinigra]UOD28842.1 hypothetical protein INH39_25880 [Massilia violaceinigra]
MTNDRLCAFDWRAGVLTPGPCFCADRDGMDAFARFVDGATGARAYLVADLVEEDFARCLLPHVRGRAGRNLVERRLSHAYRDTPLRHADIQDRDSEGRHDDHVLFSALTNAAMVQPWVALMEQNQVPLAGLYSAAHLSAQLVRRMGIAQDHLLLIAEEGGGLRQSYFQGPYLKFSRLTVLAAHDDVVEATASETAKMQQFLTSTRLLGRGEMLHVVVLSPVERVPALEQRCEDDPELAFHFIDIDSACARLKLAGDVDTAEQLLLGLLGRDAPDSQYPPGAAGRFYQLWRARLALNCASGAIAFAGALWLLGSAWGGVRDGREATRLSAEAAQLDARYRAIMASLPPTPARSANMKAAVQLDALLAATAPAPAPLVALVSRSLERAPAIRLLALDWQVQQPLIAQPGQDAGLFKQSDAAIEPIPASVVGLPGAPVQVLRIDGEVEFGPSDYRAILDSVNQFALDMARNPGVAVHIVEAPVDVRQSVKLSGKTDSGDAASARPRFAINIRWKP